MRRIIAALVAAFFVLALAGCGGGGGGGEQTQGQQPAQQPAEPASQQPPGMVDRSPVETPTAVPFPSQLSTGLPESIKSKLEAGRPMLLFFYTTTESETPGQREEIDAVLSDYRGLIDLVTIDLTSTEGTPAKESVKQAALLAEDLGVKSTPYIIIVDRNAFITWRWLGFVDRSVIEREVLRATE